MKLSNKSSNITIHNNIQNVNSNASNQGNKPSGSGRLIVLIGLIASLLTIYMFFQEDINALFESSYDPHVEQAE